MQKAIIGKKIGMTQIFDEKGIMIPVTVVEAGPCVVTAKKTVENDGYASVQLGYGDVKPHKVNKPMKGFFDKAGVAPKKTLKEFRFTDTDAYSIGDLVKADVFTPGDKIDVTGKSKGKGTAGVIKRWNANRGPMSHGSKFHRAVGSMGASSDPSRTFKNKHMPGHMGHVQVTVQNLEIVRVDTENNLLLVKGAVPGPKKSLVTIKETVKSL